VYEQLRLRTECHAAKTGKTPRVLLAEIGDAKMRTARSGFAANFFGCSGFDLVTQRFSSVDEIAAADADLIVLCSSDPEYLQLATELISKLNAAGRKTQVIVAALRTPPSNCRWRRRGLRSSPQQSYRTSCQMAATIGIKD